MPKNKKTGKKNIQGGNKELEFDIDESIIKQTGEEFGFDEDDKNNASEEREEVIAEMIKEVEMFNTGDDLDFKKSKVGTVITILVLLIIAGVGVWAYTKLDFGNKNDDKTDEDEVVYEYKLDAGKIEFYGDDNLITTYICEMEECELYNNGKFSYFSTNPTIVALADNNTVFLYDYVNGKKVSDPYAELQNLMKNGNTIAFIAHTENEKSGIINIQGNTIIPFDYLDLGYSVNGEAVADYSYEKDLIAAKKVTGWGLISMETGRVVIEPIYDDIYYNGFDSVVVKYNKKWHLLDLNGNEILDEAYDIIIPTRSYIFVAKDGYFNILNYSSNNVITEKVPTFVQGFRSRDIDETPTFKIEIKGSDIAVYIMKNSTDYIEYNFNTVNGSLTKLTK